MTDLKPVMGEHTVRAVQQDIRDFLSRDQVTTHFVVVLRSTGLRQYQFWLALAPMLESGEVVVRGRDLVLAPAAVGAGG